jgi:hypothetical protein
MAAPQALIAGIALEVLAKESIPMRVALLLPVALCATA